MNLPCSIQNCNRYATWRPKITCLPEEAAPDAEPAEMTISLGFCNGHLHLATEEQALPEELWESIVQSFTQAGDAPPVRSSVKFILEPYVDSVVYH